MNVRDGLSVALAIQLVLTFFFPPMPVGDRLIFASDVWAALWIGGLTCYDLFRATWPNRRRELIRIGLAFAVLLVVFLHGKFRGSIASEFARFMAVPTDDAFSPAREAIVGFRFFAWTVGVILVFRRELDRLLLDRVLAGCLFLATTATLLGAYFPTMRATLGFIYRYDPNTPNWIDRSYGVFQSPVEACAVFSLGILVLISSPYFSNRGKTGLVLFTVIGILFTKSITSFVSLLFALAFVGTATLPRTKRKWVFGSAVAFAGAMIAATWNSEFFILKRINLVARIKPWEVYWDSALSRPDTMALGNGFIPYFSDNIWVFFFSRGGLFLLGIMLFLSLAALKKYWPRMTPLQRSIPVFLLVAGMTIDILILRPIVYVLLSAGAAGFKKRPSS